MPYIKGIDGKRHIMYALHLGDALCGTLIHYAAPANVPKATSFIQFEKCKFSMLTDTLRPKVGQIDMLDLVARFHGEHHRDLDHTHAPWTVVMFLEGCKGPDVKMTCMLLRISDA